MFTKHDGWIEVAEVNPPTLPSMDHLMLDGAWKHVLITDNVFGQIRVSPYAYAARITHDTPDVHPTVVVSTRDRNILAIESEVRGALGNGVNSFFVVIGDTVPQVDHYSHHYEIVEHLRVLQDDMPWFEVGMPTRFRKWQFRKRVDLGAEYFVAGPLLDPATVAENMARLERHDDDPPVFLAIIPPFSPGWVERAEGFGAIPATDELKKQLLGLLPAERREFGWKVAEETAEAARAVGAKGVVLMGLKYETVIDEAPLAWRRTQ
jgi:5,10-methylenetetrahydrofolate reductase